MNEHQAIEDLEADPLAKQSFAYALDPFSQSKTPAPRVASGTRPGTCARLVRFECSHTINDAVAKDMVFMFPRPYGSAIVSSGLDQLAGQWLYCAQNAAAGGAVPTTFGGIADPAYQRLVERLGGATLKNTRIKVLRHGIRVTSMGNAMDAKGDVIGGLADGFAYDQDASAAVPFSYFEKAFIEQGGVFRPMQPGSGNVGCTVRSTGRSAASEEYLDGEQFLGSSTFTWGPAQGGTSWAFPQPTVVLYGFAGQARITGVLELLVLDSLETLEDAIEMHEPYLRHRAALEFMRYTAPTSTAANSFHPYRELRNQFMKIPQPIREGVELAARAIPGGVTAVQIAKAVDRLMMDREKGKKNKSKRKRKAQPA